jgi:ATP:ADP antiporter, AAA family
MAVASRPDSRVTTVTAVQRRANIFAPFTAAALIAQQVGSNALRDGLFLSAFPVSALPYLMGGAAILAVPAAQASGRLLTRFGPSRLVPAVLGASAALFITEWALLGWAPRTASVLLYLQSSVLGAIAISAFWSLLNERFDPHSAKPLMTRVAAAATFGGLIGGVGAERVAALLPRGALLLVLALVVGVCVAGSIALAHGAAPRRESTAVPDATNGWTHIRRQPLLRNLALVITLAAVLAALVDYLLKAQAVAYFGKGEPLVRFFGLFYAGTGLCAMVIQSTLGRVALVRLGLGGSVASHPLIVGASTLLGFVAPFPVRGVLPRGLDVALRNSIFRTGYELLYTPLAEATKRSAKSIIDVACDCAGKGGAAALIVMIGALAPAHPFVAVNVAAAVAAGAEFVVARRLRTGYVGALEGGLRRQGGELEPAPQYSMADFTIAGGMAGLNRASIQRALGSIEAGETGAAAIAVAVPADPVVAAIVELRSQDLTRLRAALRNLPDDPLLVGALVPLLARDEIVRQVVTALAGFGARAAGEMASVLLDPTSPDVVRRRLPLALKSCPSPLARDALLAALDSPSFELRRRCARALIALTDEYPRLLAPFPGVLTSVEHEVHADAEPHLVREHVFNLLALALEREPVRIAARSFATDDAYLRGTALEYLETVLPARVFSVMGPLLAVSGPPPARKLTVADARAELLRAGTTMMVSRDEIRRQLEVAARDES